MEGEPMPRPDLSVRADRLAPGDPASDVEAFDPDGNSVSLSEIWSRGPMVLTFLRHFG
jgi:peroxiredoxin